MAPRKVRGKEAPSPTPLATQPADIKMSVTDSTPSTSATIPEMEVQLGTLSLLEDSMVIDQA
jgi:hypothetical protein